MTASRAGTVSANSPTTPTPTERSASAGAAASNPPVGCYLTGAGQAKIEQWPTAHSDNDYWTDPRRRFVLASSSTIA